MYNSRPRNYNGGFAVPENYSGNAFQGEKKLQNEIVEESENAPEGVGEVMTQKEEDNREDSIPAEDSEAETIQVGAMSRGTSRFGFNASRLFRGGIGFEEILIIALILLISQSENNEDVIVLLALLLFVS